MEATLIFPHQLYRQHPAIGKGRPVYLIEDGLYFCQYPFHKNKLVLHRASMKHYAGELAARGYDVQYIDAKDPQAGTGELFAALSSKRIKRVHYADTTDYLLERRIKRYSARSGVACTIHPTPNFICEAGELHRYFDSGKKYFLAKFYEDQRRRLNVLMDGTRPAGGRWSFDADNRQKMPSNVAVPEIPEFSHAVLEEAKTYVNEQFPDHYGSTGQFRYPVTHEQADQALRHFLKDRFEKFGVYQDAIIKKEHFLFHSVLSSSINAGLLDPAKVLEAAVAYAVKNHVPFNSLEGYVRQVLGWREFIRIVYLREGVKQRKGNFLGFTRRLPASFYSGNTGMEPVDSVIQKLLVTGYAHHIERLMILGNFMLLCEIHPDDVYQWFMEMFIDAYDWVMVPNVYGMSQFADGGLMSTKPYISSSNYVLKMSDFKKGLWSAVWDALFWRFMHVHRDMLGKNPRLAILLKTFDKMPSAKRNGLLKTAETFLNNLDKGVNAQTLF